MKKNFIDKLIIAVRNITSRAVFKALRKYCKGNVLDVGGWDFYLMVKDNPRINFKSWTNLDTNQENLLKISDPRYIAVLGDGENMKFADNTFDTVLNIQVLEHVFKPIKMVKEMTRVLKKGGYGIFLIPQTSVMHLPPHHYYNFTKFWIQKAINLQNLEIVEQKALGGFWTTAASHLVHFFFQSLKLPNYSTVEDKRNLLFYIFLPLMVIYALVSIPVCLLFSLGDLTENPNNYLVIVKK